jgi:hypothetical protein
VRDRPLRLAHALRDHAPQADHLDLFGGRHGSGRPWDGNWLRPAAQRGGLRTPCHVRFEILRHDAAVRPRAGDLAQIDTCFVRAAANGRRGGNARVGCRRCHRGCGAAVGACWNGASRGGRSAARGDRRRGRRSRGICDFNGRRHARPGHLGLEHNELSAHRHHVTGSTGGRDDSAAHRRWNLDGGLFGHHLDHHVVFSDGIAGLHAPADDLGLHRALSEIRQLEDVAAH